MTAIIMASGISSRMGFNKLTYKINNKPIAEYLFDEIKKANFDDVILVTNNQELSRIGLIYNFKNVTNKKFYEGQSSSIKEGIKSSKINSSYMFFVADQPFLKIHIINKLLDFFRENDDKIVIPVINGQKKNPVIFPNKFKSDLLKLDGDIGGRNIIKNNLDKVLFVDFFDEKFFKDIDTIDDLKKFKMDF